ncbi:MAG: hypothetical protein AAF752_09595 [Bacteroidota bacterium]
MAFVRCMLTAGLLLTTASCGFVDTSPFSDTSLDLPWQGTLFNLVGGLPAESTSATPRERCPILADVPRAGSYYTLTSGVLRLRRANTFTFTFYGRNASGAGPTENVYDGVYIQDGMRLTLRIKGHPDARWQIQLSSNAETPSTLVLTDEGVGRDRLLLDRVCRNLVFKRYGKDLELPADG